MSETESPATLCQDTCTCACNQPLRVCACHFAPAPPAAVTDAGYPCARCGADSLGFGVRAINKDGRTLDLCGDHTTEHRPALEKQKWTIVNLRVLVEAGFQQVPA